MSFVRGLVAAVVAHTITDVDGRARTIRMYGENWFSVRRYQSVSKRSLAPSTGDTGAELRVGTDERVLLSAVLWSVCAERARTYDQQTKTNLRLRINTDKSPHSLRRSRD